MDSITFTISTKDLNNTDFDQLVSDIQAFLNILHHGSPDYLEAGNILQVQLDKQVMEHKKETDPREEFSRKLDELCPYCVSAMSDTDLRNLYADLKSEIGEAMGPVSYAAYKLAQKFSRHQLSVEWVWDFVKYYEENWKF